MNYLQTIIKLAFPGFGNTTKKNVIVTPESPYVGKDAYIIEVLADVEGLVVVDGALQSGTYPTELLTGITTYGSFSEVSVTAGTIKLYIA